MSNEKVPRPDRSSGGEDVRDTSKEPEAGNFSDPRVRWPEREWQKTEQPPGEWPPSRAAGSSMDTYTRSDDDIRAEVRAELDADEQCDATGISIEVRDGAVVLEGRVPTRPMKRRAAEIANAASDVRTVDNRLKVD